MLKKLFGEINLTWKKLIIFSIVIGIYTGVMALVPVTKETSFRDIAIQFECWILFGIIIIVNSKSPLDSALKCFIFFLISQPLVYLIQVPFNEMGFSLFKYYRYWFIWTIVCFPMGYIGYYIKRKNVLSIIILFPMLFAMLYLGYGYLINVMNDFPHHLLSTIFCFIVPFIIIFSLFDNYKYRIVLTILLIISIIGLYLYVGNNKEYETIKSSDEFNIELDNQFYISFYSTTKKGSIEIVKIDDKYFLKINGVEDAKNYLTINDKEENEYNFEYTFIKNGELVFKKIDE